MLNAMNVCKEQTKIAGSQFRTKNKQNRNDHAVFCTKKNFFELNICFQYFSTGSSVKINEKKKKKKRQKHKNTKNNLAALAFTETLALLSEGKVNNP